MLHRTRQTIQEWLKHGAPEVPGHLFSFCRELDVDPFCLLSLEDEDFIVQQFAVERLRYLRGTERNNSLRAFWELTAAKETWPMNAKARTYFNRDWTVQDVGHRPEEYDLPAPEGGYARLHLEVPDGPAHRVFHFAWKRAGAPDVAWQHYGFVVQRGGQVIRVDSSAVQPSAHIVTGAISFTETWFGVGGADFRVASLHPFRILGWEWAVDDEGYARFPLH